MIVETITTALWSGWTNLLDYLAAHVLLCLLPAFIIAGYMSAMIPQEAITRYLGPRAPRRISYPAATAAGFLLAVCSCTILPLFAGIWKRGAGLGPAITFLFVGPAVNILAITYTAAAIGWEIALARIIFAVIFGLVIGMIMARLFRKDEAAREQALADSGAFDRHATVRPVIWVVFLLLIGVLLVGTLQIGFLTRTLWNLELALQIPPALENALVALNLAPHGALLILLLLVMLPIAYFGFENVLERFNPWTYVSIGWFGMMLLVAAPNIHSGSFIIGISGRFLGELVLIAVIGIVVVRSFSQDEIASWLWETWKFIKQIFPLLILGVFLAGVIRAIIPPALIQSLVGENTLLANFIAVLFGVVMYFPTLVEVPIARMFLDLGMSQGPLLAYLLADPELSIQSILVTNSLIGRRKTLSYVGLVALFSTIAGYSFGLILASIS